MTEEEHRARHILLHTMLDELTADWMQHTGVLPLTGGNTVLELVEWSFSQMLHPTPLALNPAPGVYRMESFSLVPLADSQGSGGRSGTVSEPEETDQGEAMTNKPDQSLPGSNRPDQDLPGTGLDENVFAKKVAVAHAAIKSVSEGPATSDKRREALTELGRYCVELVGEIVEINPNPPEAEPR